MTPAESLEAVADRVATLYWKALAREGDLGRGLTLATLASIEIQMVRLVGSDAWNAALAKSDDSNGPCPLV